jgi:hypothetical protein
MAGGAVLVHDVVEEQEGVAVVDAGGVILSVDEQQHYVALADGPGDVEAYYGLGSGSEEKSSDDWGSVGVIGKNGRRALLLLALGWLAALVFVGMRSFGWQKVWSGSNGTAIALKDPPLGPGDPGVPIPYPKTLTAYHCRPAKNWISGKCLLVVASILRARHGSNETLSMFPCRKPLIMFFVWNSSSKNPSLLSVLAVADMQLFDQNRSYAYLR